MRARNLRNRPCPQPTRSVRPKLGQATGLDLLAGSADDIRAGEAASSVDLPEFRLSLPKRGITARAMQVGREFTVPGGSLAASEVRTGTFAASTTAAYNAYRQLNEKLLDDGSFLGRSHPRPTATRSRLIALRRCLVEDSWRSSASPGAASLQERLLGCGVKVAQYDPGDILAMPSIQQN